MRTWAKFETTFSVLAGHTQNCFGHFVKVTIACLHFFIVQDFSVIICSLRATDYSTRVVISPGRRYYGSLHNMDLTPLLGGRSCFHFIIWSASCDHHAPLRSIFSIGIELVTFPVALHYFHYILKWPKPE